MNAWAATRVGLVRSVNEDRWRVGHVASDAADGDWTGHLPEVGSCAFVADGMGGHGAGEVASALALDTLGRSLAGQRRSDVRSAIAEANWEIFAAMEKPPGRRAMGTTVAGFHKEAGTVTVFNVGDSRVYLLREAKLKQISVDDTSPRRSSGRSHVLTQSLGGTSVPLPLDPHVMTLVASAGDRLLVCTDGLTDMIDEQVILRALLVDVGNPAARLVNAAVKAGGRDNVTAVVVAF